MDNVKFVFYKGRTYERDFSISGWEQPIDSVYFTVKDNVDDKSYKLQKRLNEGITLVDIEDNVYTFNLLINATDTDNLEINKNYVFDITIKSGELKQTAITGTMKLKGTATSTYNEEG